MKWKTKTNCRGQNTPAVLRRLSKCELDLELHNWRENVTGLTSGSVTLIFRLCCIG